MQLPSDSAQALLKLLVRHIDQKRFNPEVPASFLGYGEILDEMKIAVPYGRKHGDILKEHGLSDLAEWTKAEEHPAVTGLIINKTTVQPGSGYWSLFGKNKDTDRTWWLDQIAKSLKYNWNPFLGATEPATPPSAPIGTSVAEPTERVQVTISRIVRDSERAARVKLLHKYQCQFGCKRLELKDGSYYAEAHHVKPLGKGGPDIIENIMCVCPNCHALLDNLAIRIDPKSLNKAGHHEVAQEYIDYHNEMYEKA
jgi:hypothetical protein